MEIPCLDYTRPASFGSVEIKKLAKTESIGQQLDYASSTISVPAITLDSLNLPRADLIKIDVEGMELDVLAGGTALIKRDLPVMIIEHVKSDKSRLTEWLASLGYVVSYFQINIVAAHQTDRVATHFQNQ